MSLRQLFETDKAMVSFAGWSEPDPESSVVWFNSPLSVDGVIETNLFLHGEARADLPDQNVGLEVQFQIPGHRRRFSLARLDWLSIRGGHSNPIRTGRLLSGKRVPATHFHNFELNFNEEKGRMLKGDLPFAEEIPEQLQTFENALQTAGKLLKINKIELVKRPDWRYDLFYGR